MTQASDIIPTPEAPFDEEKSDLSRELKYLEVRIAKHEEKLEKLMQDIYAEKRPLKKQELEKQMQAEKEVVEVARCEWECALAVFHNESLEWDEEVRRRLRIANDAMLGIEAEVRR
ncbi:uncharacterized protein EKO05_0000824 [Ascochyta rabiei]|uniref:uncharacterized protein n=1 Tax=Didymella rabiei TaxID=5454 RepID=UPI002207BD66|nr:uncharacterized protein EKO05_0000824 [Ascochyta rabiei]UPX10153.1 hypothetical protein EKO05_0000824 [Ascochyta rabiei]